MANKDLRIQPKVDYRLLSGMKSAADTPPAGQTSVQRGSNVSSPANHGEMSDADQIEVLERSLRELEIEERTLRLQMLIKEKAKTVNELRTASVSGQTHATSQQQSSSRVQQPSGPRKAKQLVNFIPSQSRPEEVELSEGVYIRMKDTHQRLASINPAQWVVASNKILLALWEEEGWSGQNIKDYIVHQIKVGELATRYTWGSVIQYDQEYRDTQAELQYSFGTDSGHLSRVILRDRDSVSKQPQAKAKAKSRESHSVCLLFNTEKGCHFASKCKFDHVCSICMKAHSRLEHSVGTANKSGE